MVAQALYEMNARYGGKALQIIHAELQRPVDHAVNHQPMLLGIDIRHDRPAMRPDEVKRRWCDNAHQILQRR